MFYSIVMASCSWPEYKPEWIGPEIDENLGDLKEAILAALEMEKWKFPEWIADLRNVEVRMGHRYGYID